MLIGQVIFILVFIGFTLLFIKNFKRILRNINLGRDVDRSYNPSERWKVMTRVALGQSKMVSRPIAGFLHLLIYVGFVIINIEVIEIIIDGILEHIGFSFLGPFYAFIIGAFEVLAALVLIACVFFLTRRNIMRIQDSGVKKCKDGLKQMLI